MAVRIHVKVFCIVTSNSVVVGYQHFRNPCCLHLHNSEDDLNLLTVTTVWIIVIPISSVPSLD
jgi:hypothetical protein